MAMEKLKKKENEVFTWSKCPRDTPEDRSAITNFV